MTFTNGLNMHSIVKFLYPGVPIPNMYLGTVFIDLLHENNK